MDWDSCNLSSYHSIDIEQTKYFRLIFSYCVFRVTMTQLKQNWLPFPTVRANYKVNYIIGPVATHDLASKQRVTRVATLLIISPWLRLRHVLAATVFSIYNVNGRFLLIPNPKNNCFYVNIFLLFWTW